MIRAFQLLKDSRISVPVGPTIQPTRSLTVHNKSSNMFYCKHDCHSLIIPLAKYIAFQIGPIYPKCISMAVTEVGLLRIDQRGD